MGSQQLRQRHTKEEIRNYNCFLNAPRDSENNCLSNYRKFNHSVICFNLLQKIYNYVLPYNMFRQMFITSAKTGAKGHFPKFLQQRENA